MEIQTFEFKVHGDERGSLIAIEEQTDIPFSMKRVYYIIDTAEKTRRGGHAHRTLQQVLVCISGSCKILLDDGGEKAVVSMDKASRGLLVDRLIWHEMYDFSPGCVLLALASDIYEENDYIRKYDKFLEEINT